MKLHGCPTCSKPYNFKLLLNGKNSEEVERVNNVKKYEDLKGNVNCTICFLDYVSETDLPTSLPCCTHTFHSVCIKNWIKECHA